MMDRQLEQLTRLVDELIDISRLTRGRVQLRKQRVTLDSVITSAVETTQSTIESAGLELRVTLPSQPIYLDVDPTRLAQVLINLLSNAAQYTDRGGHIALCAERRGNEVSIAVRDDGVGIPADMLPHVFEMFRQVQPRPNRSKAGLGIGLTLAKSLVELHGGSVEARSGGPGSGSEFIVRLHTAPRREDDGVSDTRATEPAMEFRVLVIDDNHDAADSLSFMLRLMGHQTRTAYDGVAGIAAALSFRPHVVLLDLGMPGLDGYEVARCIRAQPWGDRPVIVAVTGWGQDDAKRRSRTAGFDRHFIKPVGPEAFRELFSSVAERVARL
jgi:CheY-like chemotaxis protein/two-component sensor histidine kinase